MADGLIKTNRLAGHTLRYEGAAYRPDGYLAIRNQRKGHGACSCGALSPELPSNYARKRWHREHKDTIREGRADG